MEVCRRHCQPSSQNCVNARVYNRVEYFHSTVYGIIKQRRFLTVRIVHKYRAEHLCYSREIAMATRKVLIKAQQPNHIIDNMITYCTQFHCL